MLRDWWRRLWGRRKEEAPKETGATPPAPREISPAEALALEWSTLHDERRPQAGIHRVGTLPAKRLQVIDARKWGLCGPRLAAVQRGWEQAPPNRRLLADAAGAFVSLLLVSDPLTTLYGVDEQQLVQELLQAGSAQDAIKALLRRFNSSAQEVILRWMATLAALAPGKN